MLAYGTADDTGYLLYRSIEGVLGAVTGLAVNTFVLPPLHLRSGRGAVDDVAAELDELIRDIAGGLRGDWDDGDARTWQRRARELEDVVRRAEHARRRSQESTWYNPRWRNRHRWRLDLDALYQDLGTLYEVARQVQHVAETLVGASTGAAPIVGEWFTGSYADLLDALARAVAPHRDGGTPADTGEVAAAIDRSREWRRSLVDGVVDDDGVRLDWSSHAALLLAVERACDVILDGDGR
jgi:hypothetical protein